MTETKRNRIPLVPPLPGESCAPESVVVVAGPDLVAVGTGWENQRRGSCCSYPWQRSYPAPQDGGEPVEQQQNTIIQFHLPYVDFVTINTNIIICIYIYIYIC
jgi:hypothetical protein